VDEALEGFCDVVGVVAKRDASGTIMFGCGEARILSVIEAVEADISGGNDLNGHGGSLWQSP
jgi:hypothetical protein